MAKFTIVVPHGLSQEEAQRRVQSLLGEVKNQFSDQIGKLREEWVGNRGEFSFEAMGYPVAGALTVGVFDIRFSGNVPFTISLFRGQIESAIRERAKTLLA
jgi:hypothetical protein